MVDWQASHAGLDRPSSTATFFVDTRGCSSNAVYERNMGLDVPTYALWNGRLPDHSLRSYWRKKSLQMRRMQCRGLKTKLVTGLKRAAADLDPTATEEDGPRMFIAQRYWGAKNALRQRDPNAARIRPPAPRDPKRRRHRFDDRGQVPIAPDSDGGRPPAPRELFIPVPRDGPLPQPQPATSEESVADGLRRHTADYNARLHKRPKDEALWMEFVQFQEETAVEVGGKKAARQVAEKKLAVLERATAANPHSVSLWTQQLAVAQEVLEPAALEDLWDRTLRQVPHSAALWRQFTAWRRSAFALYSLAEVRYLYAKAGQRLLAYRHQLTRNREELAAQGAAGEEELEAEGNQLEARVVETEEHMLQLFQEVVEYERGSGYQERALGLLQALVEYNCFVDDDLVDTDDHLRRFRQFWESEVPRVGEAGAAGWRWTDVAAAVGQRRPTPPWWMGYAGDPGEAGQGLPSDTAKQPQPDLSDSDSDSDGEGTPRRPPPSVPKPQLLRWAAAEAARDQRHWLPCRPVHDPQLYAADPERVVLWDDVESYLFYLYSPRLRLHLLFLLLEFLGLPIIFNQRCIHDGLVHQTLIAKVVADDAAQIFSSLLLEPSLEKVFEWQPALLSQDGPREAWDLARIDFVRNVFALGRRAFPAETTLPMAYLEWEARVSLPGALEAGKALLQRHPADLVLWLQYAGLLRRAGQRDRARTVFTSVVHDALPRAAVEEQAAIGPWVYRNFAEAVLIPPDDSSSPLSSASVSNAIAVLAACMDRQKVPLDAGGTAVKIRALKALKQYEAALAPLLAARPGAELPRLYMLLETLLCHALLLYLTKGWEEGLQLFQKVVDSNCIPRGTTEHQYLWLLCLRYAHMPLWLRRPLVPRQLLHLTQTAATLYPCHPIFVSLHLRAEVKLGLVYRCRSFLAKACEAGRCPLVFLYSALAELHLLPLSPGTRTKVRNVLERGLAVVPGPGQAALWRLYLRFEAAQGTLESFKGVFHRAVDACCSVKCLWLSPFHLKAEDMTAEELQEVLHLMLEKDLHLRTFLEEAQ